MLSPVSLACVCRASSGVTHRYTQPAYTTGALRLSGLHTVTHWSEWLQTLDPQYWTKIRILPTVSVYFALNFTFRLVPHALPQCNARSILIRNSSVLNEHFSSKVPQSVQCKHIVLTLHYYKQLERRVGLSPAKGYCYQTLFNYKWLNAQ